MDLKQAIHERHSVRTYSDRPLESAVVTKLQQELHECAAMSGLRFELVLNEPAAFEGMIARITGFSGVENYVALIGQRGPKLEDLCGYYGELLVLQAQALGLNTCWVAQSFKRSKTPYTVSSGERNPIVITVGYGTTPGTASPSKSPEQVSNISPDSPDWFREGVTAALLAPTAINQQKFFLEQKGDHVHMKVGHGPYVKLDAGIVRRNFEIGSGMGSEIWAT